MTEIICRVEGKSRQTRGWAGHRLLIDKPVLSSAKKVGSLPLHSPLQQHKHDPGSSGPAQAVMASVATEYISVGGNRHPAAADWDVESGVLAFGADNNVALWDPLVSA